MLCGIVEVVPWLIAFAILPSSRGVVVVLCFYMFDRMCIHRTLYSILFARAGPQEIPKQYCFLEPSHHGSSVLGMRENPSWLLLNQGRWRFLSKREHPCHSRTLDAKVEEVDTTMEEWTSY